MVSSSVEASVGEHTSMGIPVGGRMPMSPPSLTESIPSLEARSMEMKPFGEPRKIETKDLNSILSKEEHPPNSEPPHLAQSISSEVMRDTAEQASQKGRVADVPSPRGDDGSIERVPPGSNVTDFAPNVSSSSTTPSSIQDGQDGRYSPRYDDISILDRQDYTETSWREFSTQTVIGPTFIPGSTRPTSVPNFQIPTRRREGPDYPTYPDQSFSALQHQVYPSPYSPISTQPLRTRSSHPSQGYSVSSTDVQAIKEFPQTSSGAKTVGNTPAQSPGLFSPMFSIKRQWAGGSDDGRSNTPMLHPSHHKAPKETHKLLKDIDPISGRKTINHYEILQKLGSGQHGTVKQGRDLDSAEMVAIKIVRRFSKKLRLGRSGDPNDMIKKEVAILKKARHPHVVSLIEVIDDDEFGKVYLVLEYVERGEIIWRKSTDKDIALFEMGRTQREVSGELDEEYEKRAVEHFNKGAPTRRLEKAYLLEQQKCQAKERLDAEGFIDHGRRLSINPYWSLEFAGESDTDYGSDSLNQNEHQCDDDVQPGPSLPPVDKTNDSPQSDTPSHTPKPLPYPMDLDHAPADVSSRPGTPANLEGTMWGPYIEESASDVALQATLNQIIAGQTQWTAEEEDFRYVPCLTLSQALDAFRDTVLGLEYLHYQGIIHRDIKPANLLWTQDYRVKISDFGVSYLGKPIREDDNHEEIAEADTAILDEAIELAKTVGTPAFYAPELCDPQYFELGRQPDRPAITGQIDVWALGVTLYAMIFGRLPFVHTNEFQMYEKIAREDVFIPRVRLRGVEHTDRTPSNHNKRLDDLIEYEDVDDELRDLLKRLLHKHPSKRMTLKEVKYHPWVLRGIANKNAWLDETDPSRQSEGKKIEVSTQEVQDAVVGLTVLDRVKAGFQRVGSVLRGRGSRKRADSSPKHPDSSSSVSAMKESPEEQRRSSLRGDEQIYSALRASREGSEHPLSQSVAASPEAKTDQSSYFEDSNLRPASESRAPRPGLPDRALSTADSMKTIRGPGNATAILSLPPTLCANEGFSSVTPIADPNTTSSSSLPAIFDGATRRFVNTMRSRERGIGRQSPSQSSRSSSVDTNIEDPHASPTLALSSAVAAGHVDRPPALREEPENHGWPNEPSSDSFQRAQEQNYRRANLEHARAGRRSGFSQAVDVPCPPSPDDETFFAQQRPVSQAGSTSAFAISSSSDQIVSGESTAHSRIPSVVSGASSLSAAIEEDQDFHAQAHAYALEKPISPFTISRRSGSRSRQHEEAGDLKLTPALAKAAADDEAGYNGEGEQDDSDSEDEGLAMA